jgi:hypothetical protein
MPAVTYMATGGTVSVTGSYVAPTTPGTYRVVVAQVGGAARDTATVTVPAPQLTTLTINPKTVTLAAGATRQFSVNASWSTGATTPPPATYSMVGGGTQVTTSGLFTAPTTAGTYRVIVAHTGGTLRDTATVTVTAPTATLTSLTISPKTVSLTTGATRQFAASAEWSNGSTTLPPVDYRVVGTGSGTVSPTGLYTAPGTAGTYRVMVAHTGGTRADTATVTVSGTVSSPPPQAGGACPNQPSGYTQHSDLTFASTAVPAGWNFWGDRVLLNQAGPAASTSLGLRQIAGSSSGQIGVLESNAGAGVRKVYNCIVFRQSANYVQHTNGTKFLYPFLSGTGRPFAFSMASANGRDGGTFRWRMETFYANNPGIPKVLQDNVNPITMTRGIWYRLEFLVENNVVVGQPTGRIRWWTSTWNGTSWSPPQANADYQNVVLVPDGFGLPGTWGLWQINLYYGGSGINLVPADQFIELNRVVFFTSP